MDRLLALLFLVLVCGLGGAFGWFAAGVVSDPLVFLLAP